MGYTFRIRQVKSKAGRYFNNFTPAVSKSAGKQLRDKLRNIRTHNKIGTLEVLAEKMNPVLRGWANYFSKFTGSEARRVLNYVNLILIRHIRFRYKAVKRSESLAYKYLMRVAKAEPNLFYHWKIGVPVKTG